MMTGDTDTGAPTTSLAAERRLGGKRAGKTGHDEAMAIADGVLRVQRGVAAQTALISQCMAQVVAAGLEAQQHRNGRELAIFERHFDRIAVLVDVLVDGNYRDTAARLAGIAESGVRSWLKLAEDGDPRYQAIGTLIRAAEAIAESESVGHVRTAGRDPRFWAAAATWLERKFPDKYGRRSPDQDEAKVISISVWRPARTRYRSSRSQRRCRWPTA
jgi:hypothetical protein